MRKVVYSIMASLDGYMESSTGDLDWVLIDEELHRFVNERERHSGTYLYGRRMYETMAAYWPTADSLPGVPDFEVEFARIWQEKPKVVFSRTLQQVVENTRLVRDDLAGEVARLKAQPGGDIHIGGAELAASLFDLGLVDAILLYLQPVILGGGKLAFPRSMEKLDLRLLETHSFSSGVVFLHYERLGTTS